ncbi:sugar phosphate nucleotidyltransferase [Candidatus Pelagibacter sp.]|nr:sugar phosphate nucleotidyltransferase [Candidatus Pelagibacter sp.]
MKIKTAIILCAGFGKRLMPLTEKTPKPLLKINEISLLENTINLIKALEIKSLKINTFYLSDKIKDFIFSNNFGLEIQIIEDGVEILDTGGGLLNIINNTVDTDFLVLNPDTIWNTQYAIEIKQMENLFFKNNLKNILLVVKKDLSFDKRFKGDFSLAGNNLNKINEKNYIYTGCQIINKNIFKNLSKKIFSMNEIWDNHIEKENLHGFESNIEFLHLTDKEIYEKLLQKD